MNKKTASLLLTLLAAVLLALPGRAWTADTTLTAQVPASHTPVSYTHLTLPTT